jgi:hypothetical protein
MSEEPAYLALSRADMPAAAGEPDDQEPNLERQADLRAVYDANVLAGRPPYESVEIHTLGELRWVLHERGWSGDYDFFQVKYGLIPPGTPTARADLRGALMPQVNLKGVRLRRARLQGANLTRANFEDADLVNIEGRDADFGFANFTGALLVSSDLTHGHFRGATLSHVQLRHAQLSGTGLYKVDLRGANLTGAHMDESTVLAGAALDSCTQVADVIWNGALLAGVDWARLTMLGDEQLARTLVGPAGQSIPRALRLERYEAAVRAYRQLAMALRDQGLNEDADRFAYRAQVLQRVVLRRQWSWGRWLFSWLLAALAGYGYRLSRILIAYGLVLIVFAAIFLSVGLPLAPGTHLTTLQAVMAALQMSLTAIHGRVFFEQLWLGSTLAWAAAVESVFGIVIEGVFVAMLIQRFFAR